MPHVDRVVNNDQPNVPYIVWKTAVTAELSYTWSPEDKVALYKRKFDLSAIWDYFFIKEYLDWYWRINPFNLTTQKTTTQINLGNPLSTQPIPVYGHYTSKLRELLFTKKEFNDILPNKYLQSWQYEWLWELTRRNFRVAPRRRGKSYAALWALALREIFKDPLMIRELGKPVTVRYFSINYEAIETVVDSLMENIENLAEYQLLRYVKTDKTIYFEEQRPGKRPKVLWQIIFHTENQDNPGLWYEWSLIIIDEATEIKPMVFDNIKDIVLNMWGRCVCVSTLQNPTEDKSKKVYKWFQQKIIQAEQYQRNQLTVKEAVDKTIEHFPSLTTITPEDPEFYNTLRKARMYLMDLRPYSAIRVTMRDDEFEEPANLVSRIEEYKKDMSTYKIKVWNVFPQEWAVFPVQQVTLPYNIYPASPNKKPYPMVLVFADPASRQDNAWLVYKARDEAMQKIITLETHILSGDYHVQASQIIDHIKMASKYSDTVYGWIDYGGVGTVLSSWIQQLNQPLQYKMMTVWWSFSKEWTYDEPNNFYKVNKNHMVNICRNLMQQQKVLIPIHHNELIQEYQKYTNLWDEDSPNYWASSGTDDLVSADMYSTFIMREIIWLKRNKLPQNTSQPKTLEEWSFELYDENQNNNQPSTYDRYAEFMY